MSPSSFASASVHSGSNRVRSVYAVSRGFFLARVGFAGFIRVRACVHFGAVSGFIPFRVVSLVRAYGSPGSFRFE